MFHGKNHKFQNKKRRFEDLSDEESDGGQMKLTEIYAARRAERMQNLGEVKDAEDPDINIK